MAEETSSDIAAQYRLPSATTLQHVVKISITEDKPIMLDYSTQQHIILQIGMNLMLQEMI